MAPAPGTDGIVRRWFRRGTELGAHLLQLLRRQQAVRQHPAASRRREPDHQPAVREAIERAERASLPLGREREVFGLESDA